MSENKCPKCGGEMERGWTTDKTGWLASTVAQWAENIEFQGLKLVNPHYISSFRCQACGYLESYAR